MWLILLRVCKKRITHTLLPYNTIQKNNCPTSLQSGHFLSHFISEKEKYLQVMLAFVVCVANFLVLLVKKLSTHTHSSNGLKQTFSIAAISMSLTKLSGTSGYATCGPLSQISCKHLQENSSGEAIRGSMLDVLFQDRPCDAILTK